MKNLVGRTAIALVVCLLTGVVALAGQIKKEVTFSEDVTINGARVEKGTYKLRFDEETGELSIMDGKKTVAKTTARIEKRDKEAMRTVVGAINKGDTNELRSITFRGESQSFVVGGSAGAATTTAAQ